MKPSIYFVNECPDFNFFLEKGRMERLAANRVVICVMTEFGLCNDRRMNAPEFSRFIESIQTVSGKERPKISIKTIPLGSISNIYPNEMLAESTV